MCCPRREALRAVLNNLDQWCADVRANNTAREIRPEAGEEFVMYPADVRTIVEAAAREIGVKL